MMLHDKTWIRPLLIWIGIVTYGVISAPTLRAATPLVTWNDGDSILELSGYVRTTSGVHDLGYGDRLLDETTTGLNSATGRLQWRAELGPDLEFQIHQELLWQLSSGSTGFQNGSTGVFGVGASRSSEQTVDLESTLIGQPNLRLTHDIDRLAADIYTETADITLGRQAITWGKSTVFPVADLWSRFSPYELDTQHKPGIDALRVLVYPSLSSELDFVVADRGNLENLSAGIRGAWTIDRTDLWIGGGKFWRQILAMGGLSFVFDRIKLRGEAVLPWKIDKKHVNRPRATGGVEWFGRDVTFGAEYHFNGIGVAGSDNYRLGQMSSKSFQRGESYFLGRHYGGLYGSYVGLTKFELQLSAIANLVDPSLIVTPVARYQIAPNTQLGLSSFISAGQTPKISALARQPRRLPSEFGTYGNFYYLELTTHY